MSDAMKDLGTLPEKAIGVRNRTTKQEFLKADLDWTVWNNIIRFAYSHQDEIDILMTEDDTSAIVIDEPLDIEVAKPIQADGKPKPDKNDLRGMHYKKLQALCKENSLDVAGSKDVLVDRLLKVL